jgi:hypothetical protein
MVAPRKKAKRNKNGFVNGPPSIIRFRELLILEQKRTRWRRKKRKGEQKRESVMLQVPHPSAL